MMARRDGGRYRGTSTVRSFQVLVACASTLWLQLSGLALFPFSPTWALVNTATNVRGPMRTVPIIVGAEWRKRRQTAGARQANLSLDNSDFDCEI